MRDHAITLACLRLGRPYGGTGERGSSWPGNPWRITRRPLMMAGMPKFADMFVDPADDPRAEPPTRADERATLTGFLQWQRGTLELKCSGLDAASLARRSVDSSTLSLLGLLRHMADVERSWFRRLMADQDAPPALPL